MRSCCGTSIAAWSTSRPLRDGQEIYLCWEEGEEQIAFWHEPDAGFAGRRPLGDG